MHSNKTKEQLIQELVTAEQNLLKTNSLQQTDSSFKIFLDNSTDLMAVVDNQYTYKVVNQAYCKAFGYSSPEQVIGHTVVVLFGEIFFESVVKPNAELCFSGKTANYQQWFDFQSLNRRYMDVTYSPYLADGQYAGAIVVARDITERHLENQKLRESEQRLKLTEQLGNIGTWEYDLKTNQITWSDEVFRIFGLPKNVFVPTYEVFLETVHPDDRVKVNAAYQSSIELNQDEYHVEHRLIQNDTQEIRYVEEKCQHFRDSEGHITRSIGLVHDITDIKNSELKANQNEEYFKNIIELSPIPYALNDDRGNITYLNPAFVETFGYELSEIPTLSDWWPKAYPDLDYRQWVMDAWNHSMEISSNENKEFTPLEIIIKCKNGEDRTVIASAAELVKQNSMDHLVILYDISERKLAEEKIRNQKDEQMKILDSMVDAVISIDGSGRIETFNHSAEKIFEYDKNVIIGQNVRLLMPEPYSSEHDSYLGNFLLSNQAKVIGIGREVSGRTRSGRIFPMRLSVAELPTSTEPE